MSQVVIGIAMLHSLVLALDAPTNKRDLGVALSNIRRAAVVRESTDAR
jgi:hypothetical protein